MSASAFEGGSFEKLEGSTETTGGLIIKKTASKHKFEAPKTSMLGLQKLAQEKRKEKEQLLREDTKKSKITSERSRTEDYDNDNERSNARFGAGSREQREKSRHYRSHVEDTPTYTGGVSNEAREKQLRRMERERERRGQGVFAESRERKDRDTRDRDRYGRREDRGRSERSRRSGEPRSRRSDWEETPSRSSRSGDREDYTPQHKSRGKSMGYHIRVLTLKSVLC